MENISKLWPWQDYLHFTVAIFLTIIALAWVFECAFANFSGFCPSTDLLGGMKPSRTFVADLRNADCIRNIARLLFKQLMQWQICRNVSSIVRLVHSKTENAFAQLMQFSRFGQTSL